MKNKARRLAYHLLVRYGLSVPSLDDIVRIISQEGFDIIDYDPSSSAVQELTQTLSLNSHILAQNAFLYTNHDVKLLFIRDSLDAEEKRIASAHELGHIVCGHTGSTVQEEYEANEFVHYFLRPSVCIRVYNTVRKRKLVTAGILLLLSCLCIGINAAISSRYSDYYISQNGKKYHLRNCTIIHDKTGLRRLTNDEVSLGIYEPCHVCLGDIEN